MDVVPVMLGRRYLIGEIGLGELEFQGLFHLLTSSWRFRAALVRSQRTVSIGLAMSAK